MLDPLTGICNRRQFEEDLQRIWKESLVDQRSLAMMVIDVDFFKLYNDGYGHPAGDRCLKQVAAAIALEVQEGKGLLARVGGEEFAVLLPNANLELTMKLGERVCTAVRELAIEHRYSRVSGKQIVTISVGAASLSPIKGMSRRALFAAADDALYQAKRSGRNQVIGLTGGTSILVNKPVLA